jgi:tetratricopeptide (TPR) repeat protein
MGHGFFETHTVHVPPPTAHRLATYRLASFLALALLISGCSASYNGERLLWKAQQLSTPIAKDPGRATPEQFAKAIEAFGQVIQKAPGTVWAARAQMATGSLYSLQKQFGRAREAYALVLQNYNNQKDVVLNARVATAKTYEQEQNWDEAVKVYNEIADYHPWSKLGLEAPIYVGVVYEKQGKPDEATKAFERAVRLYTKLVLDAPQPELAAQVKGYLTIAYNRLGQWDEAIKTLEGLASVSNGVNRPLVLLSLGSIYQSKLGNTEKAQEAYTKLIEEFPEHPFGKAARAQLERLGLPVPGGPPGETGIGAVPATTSLTAPGSSP